MTATEVPAWQELYDASKGEVQTQQAGLADEKKVTNWATGTLADTETGGNAALGQEVTRFALSQQARNYIRTAEGADLDLKVTDMWPEVVRLPAAAALVSLTLTRAAGGTADSVDTSDRFESAPDPKTGSKVQFAPVAAHSISSALTTFSFDAVCVTPGVAGNVAIGAVNVIGTALADSTWTVTNAAAASGGAEKETDPAYRVRAYAYPATLRRGTDAAIIYGAKLIAGIVSVSVDHSLVTAGGPLRVFIGDINGPVNATLVAQVFAELQNWVASGIWYTVTSVALLDDSATWDRSGGTVINIKWTRAADQQGIDASLIATQLQQAVVAYTNARGTGQDWIVADVEAACRAVEGIADTDAGIKIYLKAGTAPMGNVIPDANEIIRIDAGMITVDQVV